ncbi:MAG: glycosyltransferase family 2 protein [Candidatus Bathyarchaeia archaeon]|jgi:glycosyltransferase involved in cell wall biosynthesis
MDSVDVVLLTLNSERKLESCLTSVYKNVPVAQLIVVDGGSRDRTLEIVQKFNSKYRNVKVISDRGTRATARQRGIQNVTADWFLFVDSDVVLCDDWFQKAAKHVNDGVGAVWGIEVWSTIQNPAMLKLFLWVTRKIFDLRGGTHDTLIRTEAVKNIKIPATLHVFEDAYLMDWISRQGYRVVACYNPFCIHYRPNAVWTLRGSLNLIVESFRFGNCKLLAKLGLAYGFYTAYAIYQMLANTKSRKRLKAA